MRNLLRNKRITLLQALLMVMALMWGCKKEFTIGNSESNLSWRPISVSEAQDWFANRPQTANFGEEDEKIIVPIQPAWEKALPGHAQSGKEIVIVPLQRDSLIKKNYGNRANVVMLLSKDSTEVINGELLMYHADSAYYAAHNNNLSLGNFSGQFLFFDLDYNYKYGFVTENGVPVERVDTVTVTSINKAELEERFNPTIDCIAYSELSVYCWTIRECCPFADVDCITVVETYINCETIGGGGGSGGGGQGGGPTWGSGGQGGGQGGGTGTPPPNFTDILTQNIPVDVFIVNGGVLPAGFTVELAEKLQEYDDQYPLSQEEYYHLLANPNLIPLLLDFCTQFPTPPGNGTVQGETQGEPNDPHNSLDEGEYCQTFRKIVFECQLNSSQAKWLTGHTDLFVLISGFLQENNYSAESAKIIRTSIDFINLPAPVNLYSQEYQAFLQSHPECIANENFSDPGLSFIMSVWLEACRIHALYPGMSDAEVWFTATTTVLKDNLHLLLDVGGLEPTGVGVVCDIVNGVLYTYEYDFINAGTSFASAIPVFGWYSTGAKYVTKVVTASGTKSRLVWKLVDNIVLFAANGEAARKQLRTVIKPPANHHAHHIIPWEHRSSEVVQSAAKINGDTPWHMNDIPNGISIHKDYHVAESGSFNAHPDYNLAIRQKLDNIHTQLGPNMTPQQAYNELTKLQSAVREIIVSHPTTHVNALSFGSGSWPSSLGIKPDWW